MAAKSGSMPERGGPKAGCTGTLNEPADRLPTRVVHFEMPRKEPYIPQTPTPYPLSTVIFERTRIRRKPTAAARGTSDMTRL